MNRSLQDRQKPFRLTIAKRHALTSLAEYFCLRTNDLVGLRHRTHTESYRRTMRRSLSLLLKEGLVYRLPYLDLEKERGGLTYVYGLSDKGVKHARESGYVTPSTKTFDEHSQRTLDHELEVSFFHVALKYFCEVNGLSLHWQQRDLKRTVNPDALFAITDPGKPEDANTFWYFLEIERAKFGNYRDGEPQILRKLKSYYDYYNTEVCEREWGCFRQFRVVIVQHTEAKRDFLLRKATEAHRHRMFWLTTEPLYRQDIGADIFKTPRDFLEGALYSFRS